VQTNGARIGEVTSACFSPRLEKNIGYAMVPIEHSELGTEFEVERPDGTTSAVVVEKPFIDPKKETPKQELATGQGT
jgi:glycine cleavage system aminomethyltransferase T